jgi:thymidylate synthase (FAD)
MSRGKPKLLIIGHGRHGKDTVAEHIAHLMKLEFTSSSMFVAEEMIWEAWGKDRYPNFQAMYDDRANFRETWGNLVSAYNTPDKAKTASTMLSRGFDMYVGMRRTDELNACKALGLFDYVIWVDANLRVPLEPTNSMQLNNSQADIYIDNNGPIENLEFQILALQTRLHQEGFDVNVPKLEETPSVQVTKTPELDWTDKPEGALTLLDHGFIYVQEVMGSDASIAASARMSYGRGTKKVNDDQGLINYLVRNHHTSPLEMGEIKFHMRLPIFVMRQLVRHRTANLNEYSGRYSEMVRLFYIPVHEQICGQNQVNKQGSSDPLDYDVAEAVRAAMVAVCNQSFDAYEALLLAKVSRETARIVLPLNTYTEVVWKLDVSNLLKFLRLRDDDHAQYEIRVYARIIAEAVEHFFPMVYAAYMNQRESVTLTPAQIHSLIQGDETTVGMSKSEAHQVAELLNEYSVDQAA